MSAASQSLGLAESRELPKTDWDQYENPARAWIDLVAAFSSGNPDSVRACLTLAKVSKWTHQLFDESLEELEQEDDPDYSTDEDVQATTPWGENDFDE